MPGCSSSMQTLPALFRPLKTCFWFPSTVSFFGVSPAGGVWVGGSLLMARREEKMDSVTQSIHWKCQCVIDCPSLAPRCCPPSDQYHHYPNDAAGLACSPLNWWSLLRERYAGTWMWGGGGGVIHSSAESSWRSLAEGEGTTQRGF